MVKCLDCGNVLRIEVDDNADEFLYCDTCGKHWEIGIECEVQQ